MTYRIKSIPNFKGYKIDINGNIFSYWVGGPKTRINYNKQPKIKSPADNGNGYLYVFLKKDNKQIKMYIHRLLAIVFINGYKKELEVCHNDGNPANNRLENLRWDTRKNNCQDTIKHGKSGNGESCGYAKLTDKQVRVIKYMKNLPNCPKQSEIARIFNVSNALIWGIFNNRRRKIC